MTNSASHSRDLTDDRPGSDGEEIVPQRVPPPDSATRDDLDMLCRRVSAADGGKDRDDALARLDERLRPGLIRHFERKLAQFSFSRSGVGSGGAAGGPGAETGGRRPPASDAADELAQQTWIVFWKALSQGRYDPSRARLSTYLYAIAANIWLRHVRSATSGRKDQSLEFADESAIVGKQAGASADAPSAINAQAEAEVLEIVRLAISGDAAAGLTADERDVLRAIADGRSDRELATALGIAPSTAHVRKRSAMDKLRQFLARRGFSGPETENGP